MPLLYGSVSSGGLGGIKGRFNRARLGNRRNTFQQQIRRNPNFGNVWNPPEKEQETPESPRLGTPPPGQPPQQGGTREGLNPLEQRGEVFGFPQEGGGFGGRRSEAIPMMGIPGAAGGIDFRRIAQYLPDNLRRMMGG